MSQRDLVEHIVKLIVLEPESVSVAEARDKVGVVYNVRVAPNDVGRLIGKDGRVITCVRNVVGAAGAKARVRTSVKVLTE